MHTRCDACHRPFTQTRKADTLWGWTLVLVVFAAAFSLGALVETIWNFDVFGFGLLIGTYAMVYGLMALWWQVAAKDY